MRVLVFTKADGRTLYVAEPGPEPHVVVSVEPPMREGSPDVVAVHAAGTWFHLGPQRIDREWLSLVFGGRHAGLELVEIPCGAVAAPEPEITPPAPPPPPANVPSERGGGSPRPSGRLFGHGGRPL